MSVVGLGPVYYGEDGISHRLLRPEPRGTQSLRDQRRDVIGADRCRCGYQCPDFQGAWRRCSSRLAKVSFMAFGAASAACNRRGLPGDVGRTSIQTSWVRPCQPLAFRGLSLPKSPETFKPDRKKATPKCCNDPLSRQARSSASIWQSLAAQAARYVRMDRMSRVRQVQGLIAGNADPSGRRQVKASICRKPR